MCTAKSKNTQKLELKKKRKRKGGKKVWFYLAKWGFQYAYLCLEYKVSSHLSWVRGSMVTRPRTCGKDRAIWKSSSKIAILRERKVKSKSLRLEESKSSQGY